MDKKMILAVAGAGKTYTICQMINPNERNIILAYTNENISNIRNELAKRLGYIPEETMIMTFDKFIYNYIIKPYECLILKNYNVPQIRTEGVDVKTEPAENFSNGKKDFKYYKKNNIFHYINKANNKYYCKRIPELIVDKMNEKIFTIFKGTLQTFCDNIFFDEVQDYREYYYKLLEKMIKEISINMILVGDYYQHSVNGQNNSGLPFENTTYEKYINNMKELGLEVDTTSLSKSRRCSQKVCEFVKDKFNINIEAISENTDGNIIFINNENKMIEIIENDKIQKLIHSGYQSYSFNVLNYGISKGDTFDETCVILPIKYNNLNFKGKLSDSMRNRLYVALTRARKNVYIINGSDFKKIKDKYLIN